MAKSRSFFFVMSDWKWYVYMLECENDTYYTGLTWCMPNRFEQHLSGKGSKYTAKHKPRKLVYLEEHDDLESARKREKQIKNWSQEKKKKLINGTWKKYW